MAESVRTSETLVNFNVTTRRDISEDSKLQSQLLFHSHSLDFLRAFTQLKFHIKQVCFALGKAAFSLSLEQKIKLTCLHTNTMNKKLWKK
jgi:hypothetical protein